MTEARCDNCNRRHFPGDLNDSGTCPDCARFSRETDRKTPPRLR